MLGLVLFLLLFTAAFVITQASVLVGRTKAPQRRYVQPSRTKAELQKIYSVTLPSFPIFATRV